MLKYIQALSNDMMKSLELNVLVNGDMYSKDVSGSVKAMLKERASLADAFGGEKNAIAEGVFGATPHLPLGVCGTVSNVLCSLFLDTDEFGYRFSFENRTKELGYSTELKQLGVALQKRADDKSYLLRVDCKTHSYVLYLPPSKDDAYLLQANAAECMRQFTLQEWMNGKKVGRTLSLAKHYELLTKIDGLKEVVLGPQKEALVDFFSIDDDYKKKYAGFSPAGMTFIFRAFNEKSAVENINALYKRAGLKGL
jgi:hypothetical protein